MAERLTRSEIKEHIESTEKSISGRMGALESVFRPKRLAAVQRAIRLPKARIVSMVVAGLAVGWLVVGIGRRFARRRRRVDNWVEDVVEEVAREKERGEDDRTALRHALRREAGAAPGVGGERSSGLVSFVMGYAVRTGVQTLVQSLVDGWSRTRSKGSASGES
jgi:hypothetical protein